MGAGSPDGLAEARALAVSYLLKDSLRRKADLIRIAIHLIEAADGGVIWAERYDAPLDTIFDIQDDIVERVAGALSAQIDQVLLAAARDKPLTSLAAYDCWLRGMDLLCKRIRDLHNEIATAEEMNDLGRGEKLSTESWINSQNT